MLNEDLLSIHSSSLIITGVAGESQAQEATAAQGSLGAAEAASAGVARGRRPINSELAGLLASCDRLLATAWGR